MMAARPATSPPELIAVCVIFGSCFADIHHNI
jgi:hypothetical protein